ncbi:hypothetical protein OBBRIDRAFT_93148 [Obba rivulosa]|uniref:Uncharacterized protein n=1 Tax=Obba rivulosa TaxID=1052685 RepID=A0A8E2AP30_9APHY|nr:hypothetical protein OBBRIDRAFT_93148 [Obba rivulosa]
MLLCSVKKIKPPKRPYARSLPHSRHVHPSPACWTALPLGLSDAPDIPATNNAPAKAQRKEKIEDPREFIRTAKFRDLERLLTYPYPHCKPSLVWSLYLDLLNHYGPQKIPLELHQAVLRKCSAPPAHMRKALALKISQGGMRHDFHPFEPRFRTIIRNMRESGGAPELDDFHVILEQFAAVGYHQGAAQVLEEIRYFGLKRTSKTFGLCLQALCHRLTLPVWHQLRPVLVREVSRICARLLKQMAEENISFTSVNVDLVIRVLKETMDLESFQQLMRYAYGIDLRFPDRAPLETWQDAPLKLGNAEVVKPLHGGSPAQPLPFSTAALNTTIDMLGRHKQVSLMVQAFEVLTTPLPPGANQTSIFDDDDEDFGISEPNVATFLRPSARPNKMTYYMLLKWLAMADHEVFVRHYLLQAMRLYHEEDRRLRGDCEAKPPEEIFSPRFTVDRRLLLPVYAYAKRSKEMELLRWVSWNAERVLRKKRTDIEFYVEVRNRWNAPISEKELAAEGNAEEASSRAGEASPDPDAGPEPAAAPAPAAPAAEDVSRTAGEVFPNPAAGLQPAAAPAPAYTDAPPAETRRFSLSEFFNPLFSSPESTSHEKAQTVGEASPRTDAIPETTAPADTRRPSFFTFFSPSSSSSPEAASQTVVIPPTPYFDVDLDAPAAPPADRPPSRFDVQRHLEILCDARDELEVFVREVHAALEHKTLRVKEKLGRRVWKERDVYMRDRDARVAVGREEWQRKVNFLGPKTGRMEAASTHPPIPYEMPQHLRDSQPTAEQPQPEQPQPEQPQPEQPQPEQSQPEQAASPARP